MSRDETLDALVLLSALESWSFSTKTPLPDYLFDNLNATIAALRKQLLENK